MFFVILIYETGSLRLILRVVIENYFIKKVIFLEYL